MTSRAKASNVDTLLQNVRLVGSGGVPCDIAIDGDRIVAIRNHGEINVPATTERIDADGRWTMRGLRDHHVHMTQWAMMLHRFDASTARSATKLAQLARAAIEGEDGHNSGDSTIVGFGFRDALWSEKANRAALDAETGDRPVVVIAADLHSVLANTAALKRYEIRHRPVGVLREEDTFALLRKLRDVPDKILDSWVTDAAKQAASRGVTSIFDMEMQWGVPIWQRRFADGFDALAVQVASYPQDFWRVQEAGWRSGSSLLDHVDARGGAEPSKASALLAFGPLKCIIDGSLTTRTAYCNEPYGSPLGDGRGQLTIDSDTLETLLSEANAAGVRAAVHAIGDAAVSTALAGFANTHAVGSIEHAQLMDLDEAPDFRALGIAASVQPMHLIDDRQTTDEYWGNRSDGVYAFATLDKADAELWFGSDAPVAPLDPWGALCVAVTRTDLAGAQAAWHPEQRMTRERALRAVCGRPRDALGVTDWAANAEQCDYRLRSNLLADICVLDADPFEVEERALATLPVSGTLLGGSWTYKNL